MKEENGYRTFTIVGTPHYMAPEVTEGQGYTFSADIWSLGVVLFEMVCGELPYANDLEDPYEVIQEVMSGGDPNFPSFYKDSTGIYLISELLKREPAERHVESFVKIKNSSFFDDFKW